MVQSGVEDTLSLSASMAVIMSPSVATVSEAAEMNEFVHERNSCMAWHRCTAAASSHISRLQHCQFPCDCSARCSSPQSDSAGHERMQCVMMLQKVPGGRARFGFLGLGMLFADGQTNAGCPGLP